MKNFHEASAKNRGFFAVFEQKRRKMKRKYYEKPYKMDKIGETRAILA
jgi:hypothetical protein